MGALDELRLQLELREVTRKIERYGGGDRPPSPPVALLREQLRLSRALFEVRRETLVTCPGDRPAEPPERT
jgi:hypothetical protein